MNKRICLITGANSGIGKASAIQIAEKGYRVIIACRNRARGEVALQEIKEKSGSDSIELMIVDMSLQSSVKNLAKCFRDNDEVLDVLIQNAAIFDITHKKIAFTEEGIESIWATNHLGSVLLTELLLDTLRQSSQGRIITIASKGLMAMPFLKVNLKDPEFRDRKFSVTKAYYQSKTAQIMYTYWLAEKLKETKVTANCIRVPSVRVDISKYSNLPRFLRFLYSLKMKATLSPEEMAKTYTYLATSDEVSHITGKYFDEKNRWVNSSKYSTDSENIEQVIKLTMDSIDLKKGIVA
ncbi:MAG: SDR family NAD(P)-dependent oxidoreductase [Planctomycetes bacterium]|nr:SDR family NAD(P)-dependent oxidoreductase [Planctomycetota bacterium]